MIQDISVVAAKAWGAAMEDGAPGVVMGTEGGGVSPIVALLLPGATLQFLGAVLRK